MFLCTRCRGFDLRTVFLPPEEAQSSIPGLQDSYFRDDSELTPVICYRHSDSIAQIRQSGLTGCCLCRLVINAVERKSLDLVGIEDNLPVVLIPQLATTIDDDDDDISDTDYPFAPRIGAYLVSAEERPTKFCEFDISIEHGTSLDSMNLPFHPLENVSNDPYGARCVALARHWLQTCSELHDCEVAQTLESESVTRFIDIGNDGKHPSLVEFPPKVFPRRWAALSYCWGRGVEPLQKLTRSTERLLRKVIDIQSLDACIRDAILISRLLDVQYLWVDALCIFQNDESEKSDSCIASSADWEEQSSKMSYIYGNSTLTLAPASSPSVSQGFLDRRENNYIPVAWRRQGDGGESHQQYVYLSISWDPEGAQLEGPWNHRGWTLQEGLMPSRILFYTSDQMIWKCCEEIVYERGLKVVPLQGVIRGILDKRGGTNFWNLDLFTKFKLLQWYVQSPECRKPSDKYRIWHDLVKDFSSRDFSEVEDRLVAISGLANIYGNVIGDDQYFAGLWKTDMLRGLLWRTSGTKIFDVNSNNSISVKKSALPSWSWASAGPGLRVENYWANADKDFQTFASIENVSTRPLKPSTPFGNVSDASIDVKAPVYHFSQLYHEGWQSTSSPLHPLERHISSVIEHDYGKDAKRFSQEGQYVALRMLRAVPPVDHRVDILVLQSVTSSTTFDKPLYKRLGVIKLKYISPRQRASSSVDEFLRQVENSLENRLDPTSSRRSVEIFDCKEVLEDYIRNPWPHETVTIV